MKHSQRATHGEVMPSFIAPMLRERLTIFSTPRRGRWSPKPVYRLALETALEQINALP